jgi:mannitol-1-phosphate 5-dehydrogenase
MTDLLERFRNRALMDTCQRVGGDPARKLGKDDRLIGSSLLALEQGITPAYIAVGAAGAVYRYLDEAGTEQTRESARKVLEEVSGLSPEQTLTGMILDMYGLYLEGATPAEMDAAAQTVKSASLRDII